MVDARIFFSTGLLAQRTDAFVTFKEHGDLDNFDPCCAAYHSAVSRINGLLQLWGFAVAPSFIVVNLWAMRAAIV